MLDYPSWDGEILAVWVPALSTDMEPSAAEVFTDPKRVSQYWDEETQMSAIIESLDILRPSKTPRKRMMVWDAVLYYPAGASWGESFPIPEYAGGDVLEVLDEVKRRMARDAVPSSQSAPATPQATPSTAPASRPVPR